MKSGGVVVGGAILASSLAAWTWLPVPSNPLSAAPARSDHSALQAATEGRLFLSKAQLDDARSSGVFDRPVKSILIVPRALRYGDYLWNEKNIPPGTTWIRVDLGSQVISVFRSGHEIGTAVIVYGGDNKETPTGTLHVRGKAAKHVSSLYDAEMPYTLRLTDDGVSIHGSSVRWGAATHGCVGVPLPFARRLFEAVRIGDDVVIIPQRKAIRNQDVHHKA